jgi:hypothetical protein
MKSSLHQNLGRFNKSRSLLVVCFVTGAQVRCEGRARHSVRAVRLSEQRRARSDAPCQPPPVYAFFRFRAKINGYSFPGNALRAWLKVIGERRVRTRSLQNMAGISPPCRPGLLTGRVFKSAQRGPHSFRLPISEFRLGEHTRPRVSCSAPSPNTSPFRSLALCPPNPMVSSEQPPAFVLYALRCLLFKIQLCLCDLCVLCGKKIRVPSRQLASQPLFPPVSAHSQNGMNHQSPICNNCICCSRKKIILKTGKNAQMGSELAVETPDETKREEHKTTKNNTKIFFQKSRFRFLCTRACFIKLCNVAQYPAIFTEIPPCLSKARPNFDMRP